MKTALLVTVGSIVLVLTEACFFQSNQKDGHAYYVDTQNNVLQNCKKIGGFENFIEKVKLDSQQKGLKCNFEYFGIEDPAKVIDCHSGKRNAPSGYYYWAPNLSSCKKQWEKDKKAFLRLGE